MALQIRRGPTADRMTKKFAQGELIFDTDINEVFIGDSVDGITGTNGGRPVTSFTSDQAKDAAAAIFDNPDHENITFSYDPVTKKITASVPDDVAGIFNVADDLTPELGGNLNLNNKNIDGTGVINITGTITSTGDIQTTSGSLRGTHIGVVRSGDGSTIIVNNGTNGTDAVFIGTLNGNASTVTNGVVTTGSYANPSWITSLAGNKVTDAVLTTGSYSDPSWITSLDGSKVNGAVLTSDSYADPSWITSLSGSKITGDIVATNGVVTTGSYADPSWITSLSGSKVTDAVLTTGSYADPSWITSLSGSKITGSVSLADAVTNGVYTDGDQTIGGIKTFGNPIIANVQGSLSGTTVNVTSVTSTIILTGVIETNVPGEDIILNSSMTAMNSVSVAEDFFVGPESSPYLLSNNRHNVFSSPIRFPSYTTSDRDNLKSYIIFEEGTWNAGVVTLTYPAQPAAPFQNGDVINLIENIDTAWNLNSVTVTSCTTTSLSFSLVSDPGSVSGVGVIEGPVINGTVIFNITTQQFQGRAGGAWTNL